MDEKRTLTILAIVTILLCSLLIAQGLKNQEEDAAEESAPVEVSYEVMNTTEGQVLVVRLDDGELIYIDLPDSEEEMAQRGQELFPGCLKSPPEASPTTEFFPDGSPRVEYTCVPHAPIPGRPDLVVMVEQVEVYFCPKSGCDKPSARD